MAEESATVHIKDGVPVEVDELEQHELEDDGEGGGEDEDQEDDEWRLMLSGVRDQVSELAERARTTEKKVTESQETLSAIAARLDQSSPPSTPPASQDEDQDDLPPPNPNPSPKPNESDLPKPPEKPDKPPEPQRDPPQPQRVVRRRRSI